MPATSSDAVEMRSDSPLGLQFSTENPSTRNGTVIVTGSTNKDVIFDGNLHSSLSTTEVILIAVGTCILISTIVILGVIAVCKWRKKSPITSVSRMKANGHDRISNGGLRQPLFGSKKYHQNRPEIVITEPTSDDRRSSGQVSVLEIHSTKSINHVPPCSLAILEDLDENELISPAVVMDNNIDSTVNFHYARAGTNPYSTSQTTAVDKSINQAGDGLMDQSEVVSDDSSCRLNRTQSVNSTSSYKAERNSYTYTNMSPHGMQPYGIGDHAAVTIDESVKPLLYTDVSQISTFNAATVDSR